MIGVCVSRDASGITVEMAKKEAQRFGLPFYERDESGMLRKPENVDGLLVYTRRLPEFHTKDACYSFHLGTAKLRILQLKRGNGDRLVNLLPKKDNLSVLDATFGAGGDSLVISWALRENGIITSLEKSVPLFAIGEAGIQGFKKAEPDILEALSRIHLVNRDFKTWIREAEDNSVDVIYIDPMFRHPVKRRENHIEAFRLAASHDELTPDILKEAARVARDRVIVKERPFSRLFKSGLFTFIDAKRGQSTAYGVIECRKADL